MGSSPAISSSSSGAAICQQRSLIPTQSGPSEDSSESEDDWEEDSEEGWEVEDSEDSEEGWEAEDSEEGWEAEDSEEEDEVTRPNPSSGPSSSTSKPSGDVEREGAEASCSGDQVSTCPW